MISIRNIKKRFGEIVALNGVTLDIDRGELIGLLGPNGAGKSTLINLISGYLEPDDGEIRIGGLSARTDALPYKAGLGTVPQEIALYEDLSISENLRFWGGVYGLRGSQLAERLESLLACIGLSDRRHDLVKTCSGGMKRRVNFAAGIMHDPLVILLDEPTVGVDPQSRNFIFEMILDLQKAGKTIIYTTHYMEEAERLCNRIAIIDHGTIIALGRKEELYALTGHAGRAVIRFDRPVHELLDPPDYGQVQETELHIAGAEWTNRLACFLSELGEKRTHVTDIRVERPSLEQVFLHLTGRELRQ